MKYTELPKKLYFGDFEMSLPSHDFYYHCSPGHGRGCDQLRKEIREKTGYAMGSFLQLADVGLNKVSCIYEKGCFPEFERKEDLLKFINLLAHVGIVGDRDDMERRELGIERTG